MESRGEDLVVRRHERVRCDLTARIATSNECERQVRLARTLGDGSRVVNARVIDCSPGGLGINTSVYFPKSAVIQVRICANGDPASSPLFEGALRIQRATMIDGAPTYYLGTSFASAPDQAVMSRLLAEASRHPPAPSPAKGARVA